MIKIENFDIKLIKENRYICKDVNLNIHKTDKIAVIGEEGNGKSTFLKAIVDPANIKKYCSVNGTIDIGKLKIEYLPQFLDKEWDKYLIVEYFLKKHPNSEVDYSVYNKMNDINKILSNFNLPNRFIDSARSIKSLSGGEKTKIALAKILVSNYDALVLDEPTNDLDIESINWLQSYLEQIQKPLIFVSHDLELVSDISNKIVHFEQLHKKNKSVINIFNGNYDNYLEYRLNFISKQNLIAKEENRVWEERINKLREIKSRANRKGAYSDKVAKRLASQEKKLLKEKENLKQIYKEEEAISMFFTNTINIPDSKVFFQYDGDFLLKNNKKVNNLKVNLIGKKKIAIVGDNGTGKTTFLKYVYDNLKFKFKVGYMPQNYLEDLNENENSIDYLSNNLNLNLTEIRTSLGCLKFKPLEMEKPIKELSGGQKAKLLISKFVLEGSSILILDEPTRNLSPLSVPVLESILKEFNGCILTASHDRHFIKNVCTEVIDFNKKKRIIEEEYERYM